MTSTRRRPAGTAGPGRSGACAVAVVVAIAAGVAAPHGQSQPDLTGRWVLVSASPMRVGYDQFWLGTEASVVQTAQTFEIFRVGPPPERRARFVLGTESQNVYTLEGRRIVRDSRATYSADLLLISTDTTTEDGRRWLSNIMRWALDANGTLTVTDTEICGSGECPSVVTTLTFARK